MSRLNQLRENIEQVVDEYFNSMTDYPEEYPALSKEECIKYVKDQIYDMKANGGMTRYQKGICDDLKFLGDEVIDNEILEYAVDIMVEAE